MTKPITSVGVMQLVEQGKVGLDDPIAKYLPKYESVRLLDSSVPSKTNKRPIRVRNLLNHTAGLRILVFKSGA